MPTDKILHFLGGFLIAGVVGLCPLPIVKIGGLALAVAVGAGKEWIWDATHPKTHTVDFYDFLATATGGFVAFIVRW